MEKLKNFALKRPFLFGIVLLVFYACLTALAYPVHYLLPDNEIGQLYGDAAAKFLVFLFFLAALWRFRWVPVSGMTRLGNIRIWPVVAVLLIYRVLTELYAFTGSITIAFPNPPLAAADLVLTFSTGLVEETMVRGMVLIAMLIAWGSTKGGQLKAVLLSSTLFGLIHLFNLMVRPVGVVLMQALILTLPGIFYAALVLATRSLWPAIVIHWLGNAAVNIKLMGNENYQETFTMWIIYGITLVPLIVYSAYLIRRLPRSNEILNTEVETPLLPRIESVPT
jgi:membrane protease YdiL (CAAX protease family)